MVKRITMRTVLPGEAGPRRRALRRGSWRCAGVFVALVATAFPLSSSPARAASPTEPLPPFERTEERARCDHYTAQKQPFFGETHLHTAYSFDAANIGTRNTPADAFAYARGGTVGLPPWADTRIDPSDGEEGDGAARSVSAWPNCLPGTRCQYTATRTARLPPGRELDFVAVTDHAEQFGESNICLFEGTEPCASDTDCTIAGQICQGGVCVPDGYSSYLCTLAREELTRLTTGVLPGIVAAKENINLPDGNPSRVADICGVDGERCIRNARHIWDQIQVDAEAAYDRSSACEFTSFVAYEYTAMSGAGRCEEDLTPCWDAMDDGTPSADCSGGQLCIANYVVGPGADNLHRNIIFRNHNVPALPLSNVEAPPACGAGENCVTKGPIASPQTMLERLGDECRRAEGCDFLSIPHNSNISGGLMFLMPESVAEAQVRHDREPLVEITQIKGQSECRFEESTGIYWSAQPAEPDEACGFENIGFTRLNGRYLADDAVNRNLETIPPQSYVRETLKNGLLFEADHGVNPFRLGFVGALDNHNATPSQTDSAEYARIGAHAVNSFAVSAQALNPQNFLGLETNPGGLAVVWAEENSRDSIFHGLANRETYATSGTRPTVRVFGGPAIDENACQRGDLVAHGYGAGVPMGGCLTVSGDGGDCRSIDAASPRFVVDAVKDPGWSARPGTDLQRIQLVKGWIDAESGEAREQVFDVAGTDVAAPVLLKTCRPVSEQGYRHLCGVWADPDFDPREHAFYYARVLEMPSCRWNQYYCNARGVDCSEPMGRCRSGLPGRRFEPSIGCDDDSDCPADSMCKLPESYSSFEYQQCCGGDVPATVQQRAWTSPIWFAP